MTVQSFIDELGFEPVCTPTPEREINGAYVGDLLSWVMGKAMADNVWITIMSNVNIVAVATLVDVACILLAEGVALSDVEAEIRSKLEEHEQPVEIFVVEKREYFHFKTNRRILAGKILNGEH